MSKRCENCRSWSELLARSEGNGLDAYCLSGTGPKAGMWTNERSTCAAFKPAYGHAVDEPGLPEGFHKNLDAMEAAMVDVKIGSVWREIDKRFERYVKVIGTDGPNRALIVGCASNGRTAQNPRTTTAKLARFGKAYKLVETAISPGETP